MQIDVIAEGVENQQQADWLRGVGCTLQQGFLYSRPIETAELSAYVQSRTAVTANQGTNES
jgi:EAL domain-containing protein (putative c-di-GMP-specific phosphodiesterase class I)